MKTYKFLYPLLLVFITLASCKKSDDNDNDGGGIAESDADYTLLVQSPDGLDGIAIDATANLMTFSAVDSQFSQTTVPTILFKNGAIFSFYLPTGDCSATFLKYDFNNETSETIELFNDLGTCSLTAYAVGHSNDKVYIAFSIDGESSTTQYFIRVIDIDGTAENFTDIELNQRPVDLTFANNRLFVLTSDDQAADKNSITVIDGQSNSVLIEFGAGKGAKKVLRYVNDNIIISYDEFHSLLNSETFTQQNTIYQSGKEPQFAVSNVNNFDEEGKMYYDKPSGQFSSYPIIPAIFNFSENLTTLYPYENFLTDTELNFEYKIETTTMVGYDSTNDYVLIGYKKMGEEDKGGLLRVSAGSTPMVIDNIDVDGIPFNIIVKQ